ncbi:MAG: DNA translocase FtsK, partial [Lentisphaerae bacterium]|nr:DNA translocase FtsK [Lentisphaerota bacterium]
TAAALPAAPLPGAPAATAAALPAAPLPGAPAATAAALPPTLAEALAFDDADYRLPPVELLEADTAVAAVDPAEIEENRQIIQETLDSFGIDAEVGAATRGPRVTLYEVSVSRGVKVEAISRIANNLAMELAAVSLRILAPVPGQDYVGIEVPNRDADTVRLGGLLRGDLWARSQAELPLMMGRNVHGADVILDLAKAPHLLVAGATGSGKSVCLNGAILSLLSRFSPRELRLILVDPKIVEFSVYNALPHLVVPVISDVPTVVLALRWLLHEMERRYRLLAAVGARHLQGFNSRDTATDPARGPDGEPVPAHLPHLVLIIDELADLMMTARQDVETSLARLAQMSRAVGIHTILATQRPSVNVITGIIKANFPTRVAFQVASQVDSRTIIDFKGAESLLGRGDMLFKPPGVARLQRLQSPMVSDADIEAVAGFVSAQSQASRDFSLLKIAAADGVAVEAAAPEDGDAVDEALLRRAIEVVLRDRRASTSYLQRRLRVGYNRAASLMDCLEQRGIVGPSLGPGPREILVDSLGDDDGAEDAGDEPDSAEAAPAS